MDLLQIHLLRASGKISKKEKCFKKLLFWGCRTMAMCAILCRHKVPNCKMFSLDASTGTCEISTSTTTFIYGGTRYIGIVEESAITTGSFHIISS